MNLTLIKTIARHANGFAELVYVLARRVNVNVNHTDHLYSR